MSKWGGIMLFFQLFVSTAFAQSTQNTASVDTCYPKRSFSTPVVIHFNGYSRCYLKLGQEIESSGTTPISAKQVGSNVAVPLMASSDAGSLSFVVNPDTEYDLVTTSTCGTDLVVAHFDSKREAPISISVSAEAMTAIQRWGDNPQNENFYQMIVSNTFINPIEKLYLLQQFLNQGIPLGAEYDNGTIPPPTAFRVPADGACTCTTMELRTTRRASEYEDCPQFPNFICTKEDEDESENIFHRLQYKSGVEGPAKFERIWGKSKFLCNNKPTQAMEKSRSGITIMAFAMKCLDAEWRPTTCGCTHDINVQSFYLSNLRTEAAIGSATACLPLTNQAEAYADDGVVVMRLPTQYDINNATFDIDTMSRRTIFNGCNTSFEEDRFGDMVGLIAEGAKLAYILKQGQDTSGLGAIISGLNLNSTITALQGYLTSLVTNPWVVSNGTCGITSQQLLTGSSRIYKLSTDEPITIAMITKSNIRVAGRVYWRPSEASVISGYYLSGVIKRKLVQPDSAYCCTPAIASYCIGSMADAVGFGGNLSPSMATLRNSVGAHLYLIAGSAFTNTLQINPTFGSYIIKNEFAQVIGKDVLGCRTEIGRNQLSNNSTEIPVCTVINNGGAYLLDYPNPDNHELTIRIYDLQGRLIQVLESSGNYTNLTNGWEMPQGQYYVQVNDGSRTLGTRFQYIKP